MRRDSHQISEFPTRPEAYRRNGKGRRDRSTRRRDASQQSFTGCRDTRRSVATWSKVLRCSPRVLRAAVRSGDLPAHRMTPAARTTYVFEGDLVRWLRSQRAPVTSEHAQRRVAELLREERAASRSNDQRNSSRQVSSDGKPGEGQ